MRTGCRDSQGTETSPRSKSGRSMLCPLRIMSKHPSPCFAAVSTPSVYCCTSAIVSAILSEVPAAHSTLSR